MVDKVSGDIFADDAGLLLDFYGELLSPQNLEMMRLYYHNDLSLAEVAELSGITRQGVSDCIRRCRKKLRAYEQKLGLLAKFYGIKQTAENLKQMVLNDADKAKILSGLDEIVAKF